MFFHKNIYNKQPTAFKTTTEGVTCLNLGTDDFKSDVMKCGWGMGGVGEASKPRHPIMLSQMQGTQPKKLKPAFQPTRARSSPPIPLNGLPPFQRVRSRPLAAPAPAKTSLKH